MRVVNINLGPKKVEQQTHFGGETFSVTLKFWGFWDTTSPPCINTTKGDLCES